jgi:hypothetical protein
MRLAIQSIGTVQQHALYGNLCVSYVGSKLQVVLTLSTEPNDLTFIIYILIDMMKDVASSAVIDTPITAEMVSGARVMCWSYKVFSH